MAVCEMCSKRVKDKDMHSFLLPGKYGGHHVCGECYAIRNDLEKGAGSSKLQKDISLVSSYIKNGYVDKELAEYLEKLMSEVNDKIEAAKIREAEQREAQKRREKYARLEYERMAGFKATTGYSFDGYRVTDYLKVISGEVVLGGGMLKEVAASFSDAFGVRSSGFESNLELAKDKALKIAQNKALAAGANAMLGVDFDITTVGNSMMVVSASGTAVIIEKQEEMKHGNDQMP